MTEPFRIVALDNGLQARFFDLSNRYFGDFHRVCLRVEIAVNLTEEMVPEELRAGFSSLGKGLCFSRELERMGVPSAHLEQVRDQLVNDFLCSAASYLQKPEFPLQLLRQQLAKRKRPNYFRSFER